MLTVLTQMGAAIASAALLVPVLRQRLGTRAAIWRATVLALAATVVLTPMLLLGPVGADMYEPKHPVFILKYLAVYLPVWITISLLAMAVAGLVRAVRERGDVSRWRRVAIAVFCTLTIGLGSLTLLVARWVAAYFPEVDADEVVFMLATGRDHNTTDLTMQVLTNVVAPFICCVLAGTLIGLWDLRVSIGSPEGRTVHLKAHWFRRAGAVAGVLTLIVGTHMLAQVVPLREILFPPAASAFIEEEYVAPEDITLAYPDQQRNLIHIVVESLEATFYDTAQGGAMAQDLMPDLAQLSDENISFSHTDLKGGFHQTRGATFTTGGLVAMTTGVPLKAPLTDATVATYQFPDFPSVDDLLAEEGYRTQFLTGADASYGSKDQIFTTHGNFTFLDHSRAIELGLLPEGYHVWWGYEDTKLFDFARDAATSLGAGTDPFYLIVETADMHFAGGYLEEDAATPYPDQYANVILDSQKRVVDFVRWAQTQPWYANTTILITGDHESMDKDFIERAGVSPDYDRTVANVIINPAPGVADVDATRFHNRQFATFDIFPTTLAALGFQIGGDRLGLGTNLFSDTPTLMERDGIEEVRSALEAPSSFYDSHVRSPKVDVGEQGVS